jgi:Domain of unknown function (DUF2019)
LDTMTKKIKDIQTALVIFEEAAAKQAEATETGNYKLGNKYYNEITQAAAFLKSENAVGSLRNYLSHPSVGVRLWAACYWLPINEREGITVLEEIVKRPDIHSLTAETTVSEWRKGNLKF